MDFFEVIKSHVDKLNDNEYKILNYVIQNMDSISDKGIREVSSLCFVSTTTFLRFVRKLGFSGYSEFITVLKFTKLSQKNDIQQIRTSIPNHTHKYSESYLKNIEETIRVINTDKFDQIEAGLKRKPKLFFFAKALSKFAAKYINYLYTINDFIVIFPENYEERLTAYKMIEKDDLIFIFDYSGEDAELIKTIYTIKRESQGNSLISITTADNNTIQNMSDINLYYFSDEIKINNVSMTSQVSLIIIMELLLYQYLES
ncbi:MurR/RpiR family transcriptional regulator [Lactobacillus sp. ESL0791]|uniref:MurR/RpiR family transcriptional regulator n=1 Tax=Lactobacillus sp. ESL0791 TaxID=2983234 RepID=UPI0023F6696B|nr:MurR/RpiR family transcriptional regulator [Lactobacillus sp. ESL0791]MDF7638215.1 MurR/RpiR family transcriptional regulator [Lactobacillus sp. ESL0791]